MVTGDLKKTVFLSLLGHLTLFSLIGFSFGKRLPQVNFVDVYFLKGASPAIHPLNAQYIDTSGIKYFLARKIGALTLQERGKVQPAVPEGYLKPGVALAFNEEKEGSGPRLIEKLVSPKKKESVIMFHPQIPYHVTLYFKDREVIHIELMFNVASTGNSSSIHIKRKISSGNLEADLLSMRYISRYLFMQRLSFPLNDWQTVKIDLSTK
jgi:hypothetical protein